ncbi:uncharacterized protein LOC135953105 [Calliphora vicina]|uniref:uncharacterized protein LOC135953105 n=1 Tax=Calliphora vicina TaxID=7373 RepID=UPI00325AE36D
MKVSLKIFALLVITTAVAIHTAKAAKFLANKPDFLIPCHLQDPNFNKCYARNFEGIYHEWKDGLPGYKEAGSYDPLYVNRIVIAQDPNNPVALNAELINLIITGVSNMQVQDASFNPKTLKSKLKLFVPKLRFNSDYKLKGRILNLALNGNGKAIIDIDKIAMVLSIQLKLRDENGFTFTDIDKLHLQIPDIGGFNVNFGNLFNGQKALEDSTNAVFNDNWRDFYEILRPAITEAVQFIMHDRLSKAYSYVPGNYFIADLPSAAQLRDLYLPKYEFVIRAVTNNRRSCLCFRLPPTIQHKLPKKDIFSKASAYKNYKNRNIYIMKVSLKIFALLVITTAVTVPTANAAKYLASKPDFLVPCHLQDPAFNKCFAKNFQVIYREWKDGIPGFKAAGSFDPLYVKRVLISQDPKNPVALNADLINLVITGASKMEVQETLFNPKTLKTKIKLFVPKLRFDSDYKLDGRILGLALNGNGKAHFEVEKFVLILHMQLKLRDEHGFTFTDVDQLQVDIADVGGFRIQLDNLFNGQKVLEDSTNALFNENWRDFYTILRPAILESVGVVMKDRLSKAYGYVPGNYFIEDLPSAAQHRG